jgi:hypothetical protein
MSHSTLTYIYCDFCDDTDPATADAMPEEGVVMQRRWLRHPKEGWSFPRINGHTYDRCPECTKAKLREPQNPLP